MLKAETTQLQLENPDQTVKRVREGVSKAVTRAVHMHDALHVEDLHLCCTKGRTSPTAEASFVFQRCVMFRWFSPNPSFICALSALCSKGSYFEFRRYFAF